MVKDDHLYLWRIHPECLCGSHDTGCSFLPESPVINLNQGIFFLSCFFFPKRELSAFQCPLHSCVQVGGWRPGHLAVWSAGPLITLGPVSSFVLKPLSEGSSRCHSSAKGTVSHSHFSAFKLHLHFQVSLQWQNERRRLLLPWSFLYLSNGVLAVFSGLPWKSTLSSLSVVCITEWQPNLFFREMFRVWPFGDFDLYSSRPFWFWCWPSGWL